MDSGENGSSRDGKDSSEDKFKGDKITRKTSSNNHGTSTASNSGGMNGSNGNQESGQDGSSSNGNSSGNARASSDQSDSNPRNAIKKTKATYVTAKSKLPKKATDILKNWFLVNIQNPYPNYEAKEVLSKATGLTKKQIQNWFTNSRKVTFFFSIKIFRGF
jgi:Homeobox KN domain